MPTHVWVLTLACCLVWTACGAPGAEPGRSDQPAVPQRIVTLSPNLTEIAFALGLGPRVVGVSDYVTWPAEALERPRLGGLFDPNLERVVGLEPDLALALPSQSGVTAQLERAGIRVLTVEVERVEDVEAAIRSVAEHCGVPEAGRELADRFHERLAPRSAPLHGPGGAPLQVVVSVDRAAGRTENLLVAGPGTYLHELLTRLGAENVFADSPVRYPQVGMEEVLRRAPEAIVEIRPSSVAEPMEQRLLDDWRRYSNLPAVERGTLFLIAEDYALVPGPRLPDLYEQLESALRTAAERSARP